MHLDFPQLQVFQTPHPTGRASIRKITGFAQHRAVVRIRPPPALHLSHLISEEYLPKYIIIIPGNQNSCCLLLFQPETLWFKWEFEGLGEGCRAPESPSFKKQCSEIFQSLPGIKARSSPWKSFGFPTCDSQTPKILIYNKLTGFTEPDHGYDPSASH